MGTLRTNNRETTGRANADLLMMLAVVAVGFLCYANTFHVPWYLDDNKMILENPAVTNLLVALRSPFDVRWIPEVSFALNYALGGANPFGYHLVNLAIHLATSLLVFVILKRVFPARPLLALGGALLFTAHPLQTQAVTYIVQRMTCLAGLFFFLALYLYIRFRETSSTPRTERSRSAAGYYAGALACGALAVLTKQNTAILPAALVLFDRYFLTPHHPRSWKQLLGAIAPFCLVPVLMAANSLLLPFFSVQGAGNVGGLPDLVHLRHRAPLNYLVTEFSAVWIYLRLLVFPHGQILDYDIPILARLWSWPSFFGLLGIAALLALATFLRKRLPVVSAGIGWFFLTLAIESTLIPLDPVFEHRVYIPMFGFCLVVMGGLARLPRKPAAVAIVLLTAVLALLSWQRNALWNDPVAFYADNLQRAPGNERVYLGLGYAYGERREWGRAQHYLEEGLKINPDYASINVNLGRIYATEGNFAKSVEVLKKGLASEPYNAKLYNNLAASYNAMGDFRHAVEALQRAIKLGYEDPLVYTNLGIALDRLGRADEALASLRHAVALAPDNPTANFYLGMELVVKGDMDGALQAFLTTLKASPTHAIALYNTTLIYSNRGELATARRYAKRLLAVDRNLAGKLPATVLQGE